MTTPVQAAWKNGVVLWDALKTFPDLERVNRYIELWDRVFPQIPKDLSLRPITFEPQPLLAEDPTKLYWELDKLQKTLQSEILNLLERGHLLGIGYTTPRYRDAEPVWIDAALWNGGRVSWDDSELWTADKQFSEVRIVRPMVPSLTPSLTTPAIELELGEPTKRGRPPSGPAIRSAYAAAKAAHKIDFSRSLADNLSVIQSYADVPIKTGSSAPRGFGYDAVRRAIGEEFKRDKAQATSAKSSA